MKLVTTIAGVAVDIDFEALPEASRTFVIEYGLKQYIQDGAATPAHVMAKKGEPKDDKGRLLVDGKPVKKAEDVIADEKREGVLERIDNLLNADFSRRGPAAPKMSPEERFRYSIVQEALEGIAKATGKILPTKTGKNANPELLAKYHAAYYAKHKVDIDKTVRTLLTQAEKVEDFDLDSVE